MRAEPAPEATPQAEAEGMAVLRTIAFVKGFEALALLSAGLAALQLVDPKVVEWLNLWASSLPAATEQRLAQQALAWLGDFQPRQIRQLGLGAFALAALYTLEGIGLWLGKRWAEWLAVVATGLFIPLEISELLHKPSTAKAATFVLNVLVVGYLATRLRRQAAER